MNKLWLLLFGMIFLMSFANVSAWWDNSWSDKISFNLNNSGNREIVNYTARINIDFIDGMNVSFKDLRFVFNESEIAHNDIIINNGINASIDVMIPVLSIGSNNLDIYFNNSLAGEDKNAKETYQLYENCSGSAISYGWSSSLYSISNGICTLKTGNYLNSTFFYNVSEDWKLIIDMNDNDYGEVDYTYSGIYQPFSSNAKPQFYIFQHRPAGADWLRIYYFGESDTIPDIGFAIGDRWANFTYLWNGSRDNLTIQEGTNIFNKQYNEVQNGLSSTIGFGVNEFTSGKIDINEIKLMHYLEPSLLSITLNIPPSMPSLNIIYPLNNQKFNYSDIGINYTVNSSNLGSCWWTDDFGLNNATISCGINITDSFSEGNNFIFIYANDTYGNDASANINFSVDSIAPFLNIIYPLNNQQFNYSNININYTIFDTNLNNCWWSNNSGLSNSTVLCGVNFSYNFINGYKNIFIYVNDTYGNYVLENVNFTVNATIPIIPIPQPPINQASGTLYQTMAESGAGLRIFILLMAQSLPTFLIIIAFIIFIIIISYAIIRLIFNRRIF